MKKHFFLIAMIASMVTVWAGDEPTVQIGFEPEESYSVGALAEGTGWQKLEGTEAVIDGEEKASGSQSLKLAASAVEAGVTLTSSKVPAKGIRFVDLRIKPAVQDAAHAQSVLSAWGSTFGFVKGEDGKLAVAIVGEQSSQSVNTDLPVVSPGWLRLTARQDLDHKTWDLYLDGRLVAHGQPLDAEGLSELVLFASENGSTWLDDLSVGKENPLFTDTDQDGMPDAEEVANGLNPYIDDRDGDIDGDGVSNIEEILKGTSPRGGPGTGTPNGAVLYVDNLNGSDVNNGKRSYRVGGDGPKASIKAAMAAAQSGDMIVILPGRGVYNEGSRGVPGKNLTIKPLANVTIK